ncbi:hypothetical protein CDL12_13306 [Handroanthus impetiginosus]|uniref:Protein LNK3 n=1 Tax=Handroanthus impetiginosus TaxID=429701 RepID=A0A2G9H983_9LAMI|nr:hypothetical protein CDL12_13306 [Handroanthus impetiginosus]
MEWYYGINIEDLAVPSDEEIFDGFPSHDSWSSWGKIGNFNSPEKLTVFGVEDLLFTENTFSSEVEQCCSPSVSQCSRHANSHGHSDFQLNDLPIIDEADDIFLRSIFEADANAIEGVDRSAKFSNTSNKDDIMSVVDHLGVRNYIQDCVNNVKNLGRPPLAKDAEHDTSAPNEHFDVCEYMIDENISSEESVLMELQSLTVQLAKKTRLCFRDSLYRLAQNSRDQARQEGKWDLEQCKPTTGGFQSSLRESKAKKLETNNVDRTFATLLFNTMKEMPQGEYGGGSSFCLPILEGDAEVPKFATMKRSCSVLN